MAAGALVAGQALEPVVKEGVHQAKLIADDPINRLCDLAMKLGVIAVIAAGAFYAIAQSTGRQEQGYLNDIQQRLGLPPATPPNASPTPPTAPVPPYYSTDFGTMVQSITNLTATDAVANGAQAQAGLAAAQDLQNQLISKGAPQQAQTDIQTVVTGFLSLVNDYGIYTQAQYANAKAALPNALTQEQEYGQRILAAKAAGDPQQILNTLAQDLAYWQGLASQYQTVITDYEATQNGGTISVNWGRGTTDSQALVTSLNALAVDFAIPPPFVPASSTTSASGPGWVLTELQNALNLGFGTAIAGPIGGALNALTGGAVLSAYDLIAQKASDAGSGLSTLVGDVEKAATVLGQGLINFPILAWDSLGYAATWGANTISNDLWPWLFGLGAAMIVVGAVVKFVYNNFWDRLHARLVLNANARVARLWNRFDRWNASRRKVQEIWTQKSTEGSIAAANAKPVFVAPVEEAPPVPVEIPHEKGGVNAPPPLPDMLPESSAGKFHGPKPLPMGTPTEEVEKRLGEGDVLEPTAEELRAQEAARKASMPTQTPPEPVKSPGPPPPVETPKPRRASSIREPTPDELWSLVDQNESRVREADKAQRSASAKLRAAQADREEAEVMAQATAPKRRRFFRGYEESKNLGMNPDHYGA